MPCPLEAIFETNVQSVTCLVAVILEEDRCGTIAELGALNDGQQ